MYTQLELELEHQLATALGLSSAKLDNIYLPSSPPKTPPPTRTSGDLPPTPMAPHRPNACLLRRGAGSGVAYPSFRVLDFDQ